MTTAEHLRHVAEVLRRLEDKVARQPVQGKCARQASADIESALQSLAEVKKALAGLTAPPAGQ